jgi:hypothetical protein
MRGKHLYDYAVIRVVPRVEREEFINAGLVMFCKRAGYLRVQCAVNEAKLAHFNPEFDMECLYDNLRSFEHICAGVEAGGSIGALPIPERFRWLTAVRSTTIQTSRPHAGFADDLDATFDRLFWELVI